MCFCIMVTILNLRMMKYMAHWTSSPWFSVHYVTEPSYESCGLHISYITSCLVKPLWSPSYRNRFLSNRIMSKETLVSKLGSCNSLTAGTNACAQIAGLRLDGMDVGALRKTLQDSWGVMWNHALLCIYHIYTGGLQLYVRKSLELYIICFYIRVYCPSWIVCIYRTNHHTCCP